MSRTASISRHLLCIPCLLLLAVSSLAAPRTHQKPKDVILSLEQQFRAATLASNSAELDRLLSEDYVGISWNGQVSTKLMQLDRIRNHNLVLTRLDVSDTKVKLIGTVAIVTSTAEIDGTNNGTEMHGTFRYTRIYQRLSGVWKITNFEATRVPGPHKAFPAATTAAAPPASPFLSGTSR